MTREPAADIGPLYLMAVDAKSHFEPFALYPIHGLNFPVALDARDVLFNVPLVVEQNVFRQIKGFFPRGRRFRVEILMFFQYLRMFRNNVIVAVKTFFHRGQSRVYGSTRVRVAEIAVDGLDPRVQPVAEGYGLLRADVRGR